MKLLPLLALVIMTACGEDRISMAPTPPTVVQRTTVEVCLPDHSRFIYVMLCP